MAPKRSAPPPPVESSEETDTGSGTDDSDEEIAQSPPAASIKSTAPPLQQSESSDDEAEDGEEEDEDGEEGEEEEEEEEDNANRAAARSATQNAPAPPPNQEESESEEEEDEEEDDEAPKQVVQEKQPPPSEAKKPAASWSKDDHVRILEALAAHHREHGKLPEPEELEASLAGRLEFRGYGTKELMAKVKGLKTSHVRAVNKGALPTKDPDRRIFDLCKEVWGGGDNKANDIARRDFDEMSKLYPYLAEEVEVLEKTKRGLFKREFSMMDDAKARALDQKVKKQKLLRIKLELRRHDMSKDVTKTLMGLLD